jgi:single-strand DNA-binding protein
MYYNQILLGGNVTKDAELRYSQSGKPVLTFSIGVNKTYKDAEGNKVDKAIFPNVVMFGKGAEILSQYLTKGKGVFINGELSIEQYDDKEGVRKYATKVIAKEIRFTGGTKSESTPATEDSYTADGQDSDEIPF